MNLWIGKGNICKDVELKFAPGSGTAVTRFTMAVSRMKKDDPSDFINCVAFGKTAETIANHLGKGDPILVEGRIQTGSYENKEGKKVYTTDIMVSRFEFIGGKKEGQAQESFNPDDGFTEVGGDTPF